MSPLATSNASQTSLAPWHVGISPIFPPFLILTSDAAIESLLTDIPFLSVGLLGFGVLTFFFAMRKFNRLSFYVFASAIMAFIAGVLDVSQVLTRGREATDSDTDVSSVLPLLVARELALSLSIGIRFLFFWAFVLRLPRGELLSTTGYQTQSLNSLHMEFNVHSGNWMRSDYVCGFLKYTLLLAVLLVPLLQILWRVVADFSKIGPVYNVESVLEVSLSAIFIIKLFANARLSPLTFRWKTLRDYSPVIGALLIDFGVGIGNTLQFQFSETSLGRLFQAVELYILVLYVHVISFYERRSRMIMFGSTMEDRADNISMAVDGIKTRDDTSTFQINTATKSTSRHVIGNITPPGRFYSRPNNLLSSPLIPEIEQPPVIQDTQRRKTLLGRITSFITGRRNSGGQDRVQSRLWTDKGPVPGTSPADAKTSFAVTTLAGQQLGGSTMTLDAPSFGIRHGVSLDGTILSFAAVENYSRDDLTSPTKLLRSPLYGLDGTMRYHGQSSPIARRSSVQSLGMESLLRQQAELDQSVAELRLFSPISVIPDDKLERLSSSIHSDFSLSNFPNPPNTPYWLADGDVEDVLRVTRVTVSDDKRAQQAIFPLSNIANPRISQSTVQLGRHQSFASSNVRSSTDAVVLGVASRTILGSGGYDVTSFIGNLTSPDPVSESDQSRHPVSLAVERPDAEDVLAAKIGPPVDVTTSADLQAQTQALAVIPAVEANPPTKPSPPRRTKQGLPRGVKLYISGPIRQHSLERLTAYERPRPVPQP